MILLFVNNELFLFEMNIKYFLSLALLFAFSFGVKAQIVVPFTPSPTAEVVEKDGTVTEIAFGEEFSGEAPLRVSFWANAEEADGFSVVYTWEFIRSGESYPFLTRYDEDVQYTFNSSGTVLVQPKVTYTSIADPNVVYEFGTYDFEPFRIIIAESSIKVPNAFSPNGDGVNDYFNVYDVKSIVEFNATIYNRWGQQLYSWGIDQIDCESCGWDGTYKGKDVKDGVYFVVVTAKGADGIVYEFQRDVNVLRGYIEGNSY